MGILKCIIHSILLITTPVALAYPSSAPPCITFHLAHCEPADHSRPLAYDEILDFLEELESGDLEVKCSPEELERVNQFVALLAKEGLLPDDVEEAAALEEDIEDLLDGEENPFEFAFYSGNYQEYMLVPASIHGYADYEFLQCGWVSNRWKKTKDFVKKHKKEIIIGAVVVVAATVIVVTVVAVSSAGAAAAAATAGAAASSGTSKPDSSSEPAIPPQPPTSLTDANEAPLMKAAIEEHVSSFKEFLAEDRTAQQAAAFDWSEASYGEKARELGAHLAHQAYDEVRELACVVPQLCEEVKGIGEQLLPQRFFPPSENPNASPLENYENLIVRGHEVIDSVFSTDQAELFIPGSQINAPTKGFALGLIPLPGSFNKIFPDASRFKEVGKVFDRAGFTRAGRGLMKHGYREGSPFPKPLGNPREINRQGQMILEEILNDPRNEVFRLADGSMKIYSSNGRGVFYKKDGSFRGFLDRRYE